MAACMAVIASVSLLLVMNHILINDVSVRSELGAAVLKVQEAVRRRR